MSHRTLIASGALILSFVGSPAAFGVVITLGPGLSTVTSIAADSTPPGATFEDISITELPSAGEVTATEGESSSTTTFSVSNDRFDFVFDDFREAGTGGSGARNSVGVHFIPSEDVTYSFSGAYAADDPDGRLVFLEVDLLDFTTSSGVFSSRQRSTSTPDESFILGQLGGDSISQLFGSPTGTLMAGHQYNLIILAGVDAGSGPSDSARGTGFVTLSFVPEPSVGLLLLGGVVALVAVARR